MATKAFQPIPLCLTGILLVTGLLYLGSLPKEFTNWDDGQYITNNELIRELSWSNLGKILSEPYFANYAPVTLVSYALDYQLWGLNPSGYHFANLALHLGCTLVLHGLLRRLGLRGWLNLMVTGLFAIHPVNVESVSWASQRKTLLAGLFFLLSFLHYLRYEESGNRRNYLLAFLLFLISLLSKASVVVGPLIFLAHDYFLRERTVRSLRLYHLIPFIAAAEIVAFLSIHAAQTRLALHSYHSGGPLLSLLASGMLFADYAKILLMPDELLPIYYAQGPPSIEHLQLWVPLVLLAGGGWLLWRHSRFLLFWASFFFILLIPVLNIVPLPVMMANRYLYLPQIGFFVLLSWFTSHLVARLKPWPLIRGTVVAGVMAWFVFLGTQTYDMARVWRSSFHLWNDAIAKNYFDPIAHHNLGTWYQTHNQPDQAGLEFFIASQLKPTDHVALSSLAGYYFQRGQLDLAAENLYAAVNSALDSDILLMNLAKVLALRGEVARAVYTFYRAYYVNPDNLAALDHIVLLYLDSGQPDAALEVVHTMMVKTPESAGVFYRLGMCLEAKGDWTGALRAWQDCMKRTPPGTPLMSELEAKAKGLREKLNSKG